MLCCFVLCLEIGLRRVVQLRHQDCGFTFQESYPVGVILGLVITLLAQISKLIGGIHPRFQVWPTFGSLEGVLV